MGVKGQRIEGLTEDSKDWRIRRKEKGSDRESVDLIRVEGDAGCNWLKV